MSAVERFIDWAHTRRTGHPFAWSDTHRCCTCEGWDWPSPIGPERIEDACLPMYWALDRWRSGLEQMRAEWVAHRARYPR